ncbi:MAG: hypothetical protein L0H29_09375 [Sinobacteraceae bacterium]|nr:hypothetical protein [Nevskiaceae bacterium]
MNLCTITLSSWASGPVWVVWCFASIAIASFMATVAMKALVRAPRSLSAPILVPAVAWHECCHACLCVLTGLRITGMRAWNGSDGSPAYVNYVYDSNSLWQIMARMLVGWAPVLISGTLLVTSTPHLMSLPPFGFVLALWCVAVWSQAMPLSGADWKGAAAAMIVAGASSVPVGMLWLHHPLSICSPRVLFQTPLVVVGLCAGGVFMVATLARFLAWVVRH